MDRQKPRPAFRTSKFLPGLHGLSPSVSVLEQTQPLQTLLGLLSADMVVTHLIPTNWVVPLSVLMPTATALTLARPSVAKLLSALLTRTRFHETRALLTRTSVAHLL